MNNKKYIEIQWQGRAGQGVVSAAMILAEILALEGKYVQAFPEFIAQVRRSLIFSFNRVSENPIKINSDVKEADIVVLMNSNMFVNPAIKEYTSETATYIINTTYSPDFIKEKLSLNTNKIFTIDADRIAVEEIKSPFPNIPLMTVLINFMKIISLESFQEKLKDSLLGRLDPELVEANLRTINRAISEVSEL
jgi:pyruvate ferredoxin oxidoreductase gamma subunit